MIERIVTVKEAKFVDTADGKKQYLSAVMVGEGGKENKQAIFDPKLQQTVQEALKNNSPLRVKLEKEGTFWNIKEAEITTEAPKVEQKPRTEGTKQPYGRSPDERASIERQVALKVTSDVYCHCTEVGTPFADKLFKDISKVCKHELGIDSPLVAEIKKQGGVEE